MKLPTRRPLSLPIFICCTIIFTILVAACSTSGSGGTPAIPTPTPTPTVNSYTGQGYTINYPKDWTYQKNNYQVAGHGVPVTVFRDSLGINTITIGVLPDPNGTIPAQTAINTAAELAGLHSSEKNYKQISIADKATLGGQTWNQIGATGDVTQKGTTVNVKAIGLACTYPANSPTTALYIIVYGGPTATFDKTDSTDFQPTLKSLKFS